MEKDEEEKEIDLLIENRLWLRDFDHNLLHLGRRLSFEVVVDEKMKTFSILRHFRVHVHHRADWTENMDDSADYLVQMMVFGSTH